MTWVDFSLNPEAIRSIYQCDPSLEGIQLLSCDLSREGPNCGLTVELKDFPDFPSGRWESESNVVALTLAYFGISDLQINGWQATMRVSIVMKRLNETSISVSLTDEGNRVKINFNCASFQLARIRPYQRA